MFALEGSAAAFTFDCHGKKKNAISLACCSSKANLSSMLIAKLIAWHALLPYLLAERNNAK